MRIETADLQEGVANSKDSCKDFAVIDMHLKTASLEIDAGTSLKGNVYRNQRYSHGSDSPSS